MALRLLRQYHLHMFHYHIDGDSILHAARDDNIGDFSLRLDISFEVGLDESSPLFDAALNVSTSFLNITQDWLPSQISLQAYLFRLCRSLLLRARQSSASASVKIFKSSIFRIRGSCRANMPSRIRICGEYIGVIFSRRW